MTLLLLLRSSHESAPVVNATNVGGGGEWSIWEQPDFPGRGPRAWKKFPKPEFRKPTRRAP